jgi:hypothetical protein
MAWSNTRQTRYLEELGHGLTKWRNEMEAASNASSAFPDDLLEWIADTVRRLIDFPIGKLMCQDSLPI